MCDSHRKSSFIQKVKQNDRIDATAYTNKDGISLTEQMVISDKID
jgi:hypothetical protein